MLVTKTENPRIILSLGKKKFLDNFYLKVI